MGLYVELHCDSVPCPFGAGHEGPQGHTSRLVETEARRLGWKKIEMRWQCPQCAALPLPGEKEGRA